MNYFDMVKQQQVPVIRNEGQVHTVDSLGRVVIPKILRNKYGVVTGSEVDFYTIDYMGDSYLAMKLNNRTGDRAKWMRAIDALRELNLEVPQELIDMAAGTKKGLKG